MHLSPNTHVTAFVVGTVPFSATADTCAETAECRLQCTRRGVRTANLHAVRSAITATAELLVIPVLSWLESSHFSSYFSYLGEILEILMHYVQEIRFISHFTQMLVNDHCITSKLVKQSI